MGLVLVKQDDVQKSQKCLQSNDFPFFLPGSELNQVQVLLQSPSGDETILPSWD